MNTAQVYEPNKIRALTNTEENLEALYLDYFNNYLTLEVFADHKGMSEYTAGLIIEAGRKINHERPSGLFAH